MLLMRNSPFCHNVYNDYICTDLKKKVTPMLQICELYVVKGSTFYIFKTIWKLLFKPLPINYIFWHFCSKCLSKILRGKEKMLFLKFTFSTMSSSFQKVKSEWVLSLLFFNIKGELKERACYKLLQLLCKIVNCI